MLNEAWMNYNGTIPLVLLPYSGIVYTGFPEPRKTFLISVWRSRETQAEVSGSPEGHAVGHSCLYTTHREACLVRFSTLVTLAW